MRAREWLETGIAFAALAACDAAGRAIASVLGLPVPGTVIGILLALGGMAAARRAPHPALVRASERLLAHLNLFFVPAAVAIVAHGALVRRDLWPIVAALVASTFAALVVAGWTFERVLRAKERS